MASEEPLYVGGLGFGQLVAPAQALTIVNVPEAGYGPAAGPSHQTRQGTVR